MAIHSFSKENCCIMLSHWKGHFFTFTECQLSFKTFLTRATVEKAAFVLLTHLLFLCFLRLVDLTGLLSSSDKHVGFIFRHCCSDLICADVKDVKQFLPFLCCHKVHADVVHPPLDGRNWLKHNRKKLYWYSDLIKTCELSFLQRCWHIST